MTSKILPVASFLCHDSSMTVRGLLNLWQEASLYGTPSTSNSTTERLSWNWIPFVPIKSLSPTLLYSLGDGFLTSKKHSLSRSTGPLGPLS